MKNKACFFLNIKGRISYVGICNAIEHNAWNEQLKYSFVKREYSIFVLVTFMFPWWNSPSKRNEEKKKIHVGL